MVVSDGIKENISKPIRIAPIYPNTIPELKTDYSYLTPQKSRKIDLQHHNFKTGGSSHNN